MSRSTGTARKPDSVRAGRKRSHAYVVERRTRVCHNTVFDIYFDRIAIGDGQRIEQYLVVAPKARNRGGVTGVAILPVVNGRFGLLRLYRHAVASEVWEVPRGFIDAGEATATAALRELEEETGLRCRRAALISLGKIFPEAGILSAQVALFAAEVAAQEIPTLGEEFGHREFRLVTGKEFERMISNGRIQDPTTLVTYFKYVGRHASRRRRATKGNRQKTRRSAE